MAARLFSTFLILSATFSLLTHSLASNSLNAGESLNAGQEIMDGSCGLAMQTDCNLVLYDSGIPIWATDTSGQGENCVFSVEYSGNLVMYDSQPSGDAVLWSSETVQPQEDRYYVMVKKEDCKVALYGSDNSELWSTKTKRVGTANVKISSNSTDTVVNAGDKISMVTDTEN